MLIWFADANGQLEKQDTIEHGGVRIVGPQVEAEKQNGEMEEIF